MSHSHLIQKAVVGMALVMFVGGGLATATNYLAQKSDYAVIIDDQRVPQVMFQRRLIETRQMFTDAHLPDPTLRQQAIKLLIQRELMLRAAKERQLPVSDAEISQEWERLLKESYGGQMERMQVDLQRSFYTQADFREELRERLLMRKLEDKLEEKFKVPDASIDSYYRSHQDQFREPEKIQAWHILFKADGGKPAEVAQAKAKAEAVIQQLEAGADFQTLAKQKSDDAGSRVTGGSLGSFRKGEMVPAFEAAAWHLAPGEYTHLPVRTDYGWHVILRGKTEPGRLKPLSEVKAEIASQLLEEEKRRFMQNWLRQEEQASHILINPSLTAGPHPAGSESPATPSGPPTPSDAPTPMASPTPARFQSAIPPIKH